MKTLVNKGQQYPTGGGVGHINQLERLPGTTRTNKQGMIAKVALLHLGQRLTIESLEA